MSLIEELKDLIIPYQVIKDATENFTSRIGRGGYGAVYRGQLAHTLVAVKQLQLGNNSGQGVKEFLTEIQLLSRYKHRNLVSLVGFCEERNEKFLVYEFAVHGSLDNYLKPKKTMCPLTWKQRISICVDAARGLDHLHNHVGQNERVIHRDIKSANILLGHNWKGMIADFGLSKLGRANENDTYLITNACGTHGYCDPAYTKTGILTKESDIYSFGVVLLEVLCGRLCFINVDSGEGFLAPLAQHYYKDGKLNRLIDPELKNHLNLNSIRVFSEIAFQCLQDDRKRRPSMGFVLHGLEKAFELLEMEEASELLAGSKEHEEAPELKGSITFLKTNPAVTEIPGNNRTTPLDMAALFERPDMVRYMYRIFKEMGGDFWEQFLQKCVEADIFDVALQIVKDRPELLVKKGLLTDVLIALAQKTRAFNGITPYIVFRIIKSLFHVTVGPGEKESEAVQLLRIIWENIIRMPKSEIDGIIRGPCVTQTVKGEHAIKVYPSQVLFLAVKVGNTRFLVELIRSYPDLIWKLDDKGKTIFHVAIEHHQTTIYNLLYEIGELKDLITVLKDKEGNNMLHMCGKSIKQNQFQNVSGVALQMQRELLWFKEVEQMIPPAYRLGENEAGETPQVLFAKKQADLVTEGGLMKNVASQFMVVANLLTTILYSVAFTPPGVYNKNTTGSPFFQKEPAIIIFWISSAISVISVSTSIFMFNTIFTSRYATVDFVESLRKKLALGLTTLFLSIVTMMVAFTAVFFVLHKKNMEWVPLPITIIAMVGMPVIVFYVPQLRFLREVFYKEI